MHRHIYSGALRAVNSSFDSIFPLRVSGLPPALLPRLDRLFVRSQSAALGTGPLESQVQRYAFLAAVELHQILSLNLEKEMSNSRS